MTIAELYALYRENPVLSTDSRQCPEGCIFVALRGETFDGNRFALAALDSGCRVAVVSDATVTTEYAARGGDSARVMVVPDTLVALKQLAREHRRQFNIPVIGITGTNGKTTTKELVRAVLAERYRVMATEGNYNNDVGVPKTLLRLSAEHDIAIVEMGASHPGDIATLAATAEPTCGLITNVGKAHLLGFGSLQGVVNTKGELYQYLASRPDGGHIFVNADNELLTAIVPARTSATRYSQRGTASCRVCGEVVACDPMLRFRWRDNECADGTWHHVDTHLIGSYNLDNALAAITVGLHFGVAAADICHALSSYEPSNNRSQLTATPHNTLVVDAYNANPTSMEAALNNFELMQVPHKMAIIGEMRELGEASHDEHQRLVDRLLRCHFERVWLVGHEFDGLDAPFARFADVEAVRQAIAADQPQGFHILIKGSNGNRLFELPSVL